MTMELQIATSAAGAPATYDESLIKRKFVAFAVSEQTLMDELHQMLSHVDALLRQGGLLTSETGWHRQKIRLPRQYHFTSAYDQQSHPHLALDGSEGRIWTERSDAGEFCSDAHPFALDLLARDLESGWLDQIAEFVTLNKTKRLAMLRQKRKIDEEDEIYPYEEDDFDRYDEADAANLD